MTASLASLVTPPRSLPLPSAMPRPAAAEPAAAVLGPLRAPAQPGDTDALRSGAQEANGHADRAPPVVMTPVALSFAIDAEAREMTVTIADRASGEVFRKLVYSRNLLPEGRKPVGRVIDVAA